MDNQPPIAPVSDGQPEPQATPAVPVPVTPPIVPTEPAAPAVAAVSALAPEATQPAAEPQGSLQVQDRARRILLVEDDDALANVYQTRLSAEGFDIRRCANGEEALAAALNYHPDLILLDVMMPKVSGFDVLDILRNTPETASLKIIMLTALSQDSDKERAKSLGVDDYLVKSQVVIADVIDRIKHHLRME